LVFSERQHLSERDRPAIFDAVEFDDWVVLQNDGQGRLLNVKLYATGLRKIPSAAANDLQKRSGAAKCFLRLPRSRQSSVLLSETC
jgi:hypothetical protein